VKLAVRHALGKYHITPSLDFNAENKIRSAGVQSRGGFTRLDPIQRKNLEQWNQIYEGMISVEPETQATEITISSGIGQPMEQSSEMFSDDTEQASPYLLHGKYILLPIKSGFMVIDQRAARERILFEQLKEKLKQAERSSQKILFPESIELSMKQSEVFAEVHDAFWQIGFEIESFGKQSVIVHGIPAILTEQKNMYTLIVDLLDAYAEEKDSQDVPSIELAKAIAKSISGQKRSSLSVEEMRNLVDQLFGCEIPFRTPSGKNCFISIDLDELKNRFNR
jgi:DNA mismatch repair protein MutL